MLHAVACCTICDLSVEGPLGHGSIHLEPSARSLEWRTFCFASTPNTGHARAKRRGSDNDVETRLLLLLVLVLGDQPRAGVSSAIIIAGDRFRAALWSMASKTALQPRGTVGVGSVQRVQRVLRGIGALGRTVEELLGE